MRVLLEQAGGPFYAVELGRLDGRTSTKASVGHHLPGPDFNLDQLSALFAKHGLTLTNLVALSGTPSIPLFFFSFFFPCTWRKKII
jgi:peroxidase